MELDKRDKKLLSYFYHNYRSPLTKIAKQCSLSREQVEYRLHRYEKERVIKKYITIFNYPSFGFKEFIVVWFKLRDFDKDVLKKELLKMEIVTSVGDTVPNNGIFANFVVKDKTDFEKMFYLFLHKHKESIKSYNIFMCTNLIFYPLKILGNPKEEIIYEVLNPASEMNVDKKDVSILKELQNNGRIKIIDIAKKTNLSSELIIYKLKQLFTKKIILGTRIQFDMDKLGFHLATLKVNFRNLSDEMKKRIMLFCKNNDFINALSFGISDYNCLIQIFYSNEKDLRDTLNKLNQTFNEEIIDSSLILIGNESEAKTLSL